jgi:hypothetical protein
MTFCICYIQKNGNTIENGEKILAKLKFYSDLGLVFLFGLRDKFSKHPHPSILSIKPWFNTLRLYSIQFVDSFVHDVEGECFAYFFRISIRSFAFLKRKEKPTKTLKLIKFLVLIQFRFLINHKERPFFSVFVV